MRWRYEITIEYEFRHAAWCPRGRSCMMRETLNHGDEGHRARAEERREASSKWEQELRNTAQPGLLNDASSGGGGVSEELNNSGGEGGKADVVIGGGQESEKTRDAIPISKSTGGVIGGGMDAAGGTAHGAQPMTGGPNHNTVRRGLEWGFGHGAIQANVGLRGGSSGSGSDSSGGITGGGTGSPQMLGKMNSRWWGSGGGGDSGSHGRQGNNGGVSGGHLEVGVDNWAGIDNDVHVSETAIRNLNPRGNLRVGVGSYSGGYNIARIGDSDSSNARGHR